MRKTRLKKTDKLITILLIALVTCFCVCDLSNKITLVKNGFSEYTIFISENAALPEKFAAREFQKIIKQISSCELPIANAVKANAKIIYIGFDGAPESLLSGLNISEFGNEEYIIRTIGNDLLIAGGKPRGTVYGVIGFLSDHLGCRWYTREKNKIPQKAVVTIGHIEDRQKPTFEYREAFYPEAHDATWAVYNRLNPSIKPPPDSLGGGYNIYPFVHTFYQLVPPKKYFKNHPEYFSEIKGKRQEHEAQLCLTNPEVVKIATRTVFRWIEEHPGAQVISVDQNDGYGYCECPKCNALDEAEGSHSATVLNFVNQIADSVAQTHPNIKLQTLAYAYTEIPPRTIVPRPNVTIRLCHYEYCSAHSLEGCESHAPFIEGLKAWCKIAERVTIWDYFTDFNEFLVPFPNFETMKNDVRFYADHNCIGLFAQGSYVPQNGGGEFSELRAWVFSQLMWNPYQDAQALIDEFVTNVYGQGAPFIKQYIELLHEKVKPDSVYFSIYAKPTDGGYLTPELVKETEALFLQAEQAVSHDPLLLKRIELAHLPILYAQLYFYSIGGREHLSQQNMPAVLGKFQRILKEHNITRMAENRSRGDIQEFIKQVKAENKFIADWWIIGPFDNPDENGLQIVYPPEKEFRTDKTYRGRKKCSVNWKHHNSEFSGYVDFTKLFGELSDSGVAYAWRTINVQKNASLKIGIGSNDGVRLWVNGKLVLDNKIARKADPNQDVLIVPFKKGENTVLLKIDQLGGGWGFYFSVIEGGNIL